MRKRPRSLKCVRTDDADISASLGGATISKPGQLETKMTQIPKKALAVLATYNEQRFVGACLKNLIRQGFEVYLIDNESTDHTLDVAREYVGHGLIHIESLVRHGIYSWERILQRKAEIARDCDHDWVMHVDADEIRLPPPDFGTILEAIEGIDSQGYNAINFVELCFVPTLEAPDHEHPDFQSTMRWYYPLRPCMHHRLNLWKRTPVPVELAASGGHRVDFEGIRVWPTDFPMRHYLFLSAAHAKAKWVDRIYDPEELKRGWHRSRAELRATDIALQSCRELRLYRSDAELDASDPLSSHPVLTRRTDTEPREV